MDYKTLMEKRAAARAKREAIAAKKAAEEVEEVKIEEEQIPTPKKRGRRPNNRVFMVTEDAQATQDLLEGKEEEKVEKEAPVEKAEEEEVQKEEEEDLVLGESILE